MQSVEALMRASLRTWVASLPWSTVPAVTADAPEPGDKPALPTLACWFERIEVANATPLERAPGVFDTGQAEAAVTFLFRCSSEAQADAFRAEWRDLAWTAAMDASPSGLAPALPFQIEIAGSHFSCKLYLEATLELASFEDTQVRGLWLLRAFGRLAYPAIALRSPTALLSCSMQVNGVVYQLSDFQAPRLLLTAPRAGETVPPDAVVDLVFDQPMATFGLPGFSVTAGANARHFTIQPISGWKVGSNPVHLPSSLRSAKGMRLSSDLTLYFIGASP